MSENKNIRLLIDCFGGDNSPSANVEGALCAIERFNDLHLILTGDEELIKKELENKKADMSRIEIVHAPDIVTCNDKPTDAIRLKKDSSMMRAVRLLREDDSISGMVSTGSTGALVAAATLRIGRLRGVIRPAFCPILPTMNGGIVGICDSGANVDVTADYLQQFAIMGSLYLETVYGVSSPHVALLNIGTEETKGDNLRKEAFSVLRDTPGINFVGNMESRDLLTGKFDLVVCDGFSGNVLIKSTEGACLEMLKKLKKDISSSIINKFGALFMYRMFMREKEFMNYQNYGGSVLLGTSKVVVKGHGSSNADAVAKCIEQAYLMGTGALTDKIEAALDVSSDEE
ncbi:MAG: phosphate acyltransferase PlsX [Clostridia bacterium]|nr:phosphate acyltransferase PlsX [Clostridia bacterium]